MGEEPDAVKVFATMRGLENLAEMREFAEFYY